MFWCFYSSLKNIRCVHIYFGHRGILRKIKGKEKRDRLDIEAIWTEKDGLFAEKGEYLRTEEIASEEAWQEGAADSEVVEEYPDPQRCISQLRTYQNTK